MMRHVEGVRLIGLSGLKSSGKDTVGRYLADRYGFETISFAASLKASASALFGIDPSAWESMKNDPDAMVTLVGETPPYEGASRISMTARQFLQRYGTEAHRGVFGEDFWVKALFDPLDMGGRNLGKRYAITDVRFPDEHVAVHDRGGIVVRIERPTDDHSDTHASETLPGYDLVDWIIRNDGTFDDLYLEVDRVIRAEE